MSHPNVSQNVQPGPGPGAADRGRSAQAPGYAAGYVPGQWAAQQAHPTAPPPYAPPPPAAPKRHVVRWVLLGLVAGAVLLFGGCSLLMVGAAAGSASHAPAPTATAPAQPSNPFPSNGDNGQAPTAPTVTAPRTFAAGTYEITAKPGGQWTITPGTYETNAGYGYALITKAADGQVGDPGYRMVAVNGHTLVQLKQGDVGKYIQFVGPADWTAKS